MLPLIHSALKNIGKKMNPFAERSLRHRAGWYVSALVSLIVPCIAADVSAARPNLVLIMADDLGAGELGCYGHVARQTPRLDRMADAGIRFKTCYATPNCSPSRMMNQFFGIPVVRIHYSESNCNSTLSGSKWNPQRFRS